jgi:four helix bundle protein
MRNLEHFDAWKCARDLARTAYELTLAPSLRGHWALTDQVRRSALSIPANIGEGYALGTTPQFLRCLRISLGSTVELRGHLDLAQSLGLVPAANVASVVALCDRMINLLLGLIRKLARADGSRLPSPASRSRHDGE